MDSETLESRLVIGFSEGEVNPTPQINLSIKTPKQNRLLYN